MFILMLYTSSFVFQPKSLQMIPFQTKEACITALNEAKQEWVTINELSKCVDLELEAQIKEKQLELKKLKGAQ